MPIALFDLDNTLIAGDSDHGWGEFLVSQNRVDPAYYSEMNDRFYRDYQAGNLDMNAYLEFALQPLAELNKEELLSLHDIFMQEVIAPMWLPRAEQLLQQHRNQGDLIIIITSTNRFVVEPISNKLGADVLIATEPEQIDGHYTGRVNGVPSYKEGKVVRLNAWLAETGKNLDGSSFYSDSINDLPLLEIVDRPVAVDPCPKLRSVAEQRQWEIISLRD
ncbi:MAG: HAD family hydrolase [Gammaproteobacteria bacterium]|nr:MAG: HAD family hydrolase [Gammaproteobacteria bacterium]